MISRKTCLSLVQYVALQARASAGLLCEKHGLPYSDLISIPEANESHFIRTLSDSVAQAEQNQICALLDEVLRTKNEIRSRISPKTRHDERFMDLERCLFLDGFVIVNDKLVPQDPTITDTPPVEDDLTQALHSSGLPGADFVLQKLQDSTDQFRRTPPTLNASLNDARIALQSLAKSIAVTLLAKPPENYDDTKWGSVLQYLRNCRFVTDVEEKGLAGVFGFVSPGSHVPLGLSEMEMTRLGRSFVTGMCWFLIKRYIHYHA
jgi:hypothetical protein